MEKETDKKVVVSLIQPTGKLHLGNYLGAIRQWIALQDFEHNDCRFGIADLHSLTAKIDGSELKTNSENLILDLIALGINEENVYIQSQVSNTAELMWYLMPYVSHSEMKRMTQFKGKKDGNMGLFNYPLLQAADILIQNADKVPVGEDQKQHLELCQTIATRLNLETKGIVNIPKPLIVENTKVYSVRDPEKKMSKSLGDAHCIYLSDSMEVIDKKISKMPTDSHELVGTTDMTPGVRNIYNLLKAFADEKVYEDMYNQYISGTIQYGALKAELKIAIKSFIADFQKKRANVEANRQHYINTAIDNSIGDYSNGKICHVLRKKKGLDHEYPILF